MCYRQLYTVTYTETQKIQKLTNPRSVNKLCWHYDVEINQNTKLVSALKRGGLCIINERVEKIFVVAEKYFHMNTQKFGLAVLDIKVMIVEKLKSFCYIRDFLMILNIFWKYQCQKKLWMLHYITYYIYCYILSFPFQNHCLFHKKIFRFKELKNNVNAMSQVNLLIS